MYRLGNSLTVIASPNRNPSNPRIINVSSNGYIPVDCSAFSLVFCSVINRVNTPLAALTSSSLKNPYANRVRASDKSVHVGKPVLAAAVSSSDTCCLPTAAVADSSPSVPGALPNDAAINS